MVKNIDWNKLSEKVAGDVKAEKKHIGSAIEKGVKKIIGKVDLRKKVVNKSILKKEPRATYVVESAPDYRSSSFRKAWSKESILKWT